MRVLALSVKSIRSQSTRSRSQHARTHTSFAEVSVCLCVRKKRLGSRPHAQEGRPQGPPRACGPRRRPKPADVRTRLKAVNSFFERKMYVGRERHARTMYSSFKRISCKQSDSKHLRCNLRFVLLFQLLKADLTGDRRECEPVRIPEPLLPD